MEDTKHIYIRTENVQQKLKVLGYYDGKEDGILGPQTKSALIRFQKAKKLKADGIIGSQVKKALKIN